MNSQQSAHPKQEIGGMVPEISLPLVQGGTGTLQGFLKGKKGLLVVFWSETCSHCLRYDSFLNEFPQRYPELGLVVIACRQGETAEEILATIAQRNLRFPILHDQDSRIARQWHTQQTPRVFLLDANRRLLYRGAIDNYRYPADPDYQAYLRPAIEAFLAGKPIERPETASFGCAVQSVYYQLPKPLARS
ncbi:MAG TPA: redoxin family protein [Terriglobia bacterium]|nr:redoxin family protein [Terriglobia bacterium]